MQFGKVLRVIRANKNITQSEMASFLDISQNYLSLIENNKRYLSPQMIENFSSKLNISKDMLYIISSNVPQELNDEEKKSFVKIQNNILSIILSETNDTTEAYE